MGVAADCTYVANYKTQEAATSQILNNWNSASALYKVGPKINLNFSTFNSIRKSTFNVSLGIAELQVRSAMYVLHDLNIFTHTV